MTLADAFEAGRSGGEPFGALRVYDAGPEGDVLSRLFVLYLCQQPFAPGGEVWRALFQRLRLQPEEAAFLLGFLSDSEPSIAASLPSIDELPAWAGLEC